MRRTSIPAVLAVLVSLCVPATSFARDSDAPAGAPADWLPPEAWVTRHWLPYDEDALRSALGLRDRGALLGAVSDTRTLSDVARAKGLDPGAVVADLVRPWRGRVSPDQHRLLASRARRTFTQPHLAVHMFSHPFHIDPLNSNWTKLFGATIAVTYAQMHEHGLSYLEVAQRNRGARVPLVAELRRMFRGIAADGVRRHEMLPSEGARVAAYQSAVIGGWLAYRTRPKAAAAMAAALCRLPSGG